MEVKESWIKNGFVNEPCDKVENIREEFLKLKKEKNAVLMAHFYQEDDIQDIADYIFVGVHYPE